MTLAGFSQTLYVHSGTGMDDWILAAKMDLNLPELWTVKNCLVWSYIIQKKLNFSVLILFYP
jgi:hypothetical protein